VISIVDIPIFAKAEYLALVCALRRAQCAVLFGSCAANCYSERSDVDILCVGSGRRFKTYRLDIVWISAARTCDRGWLGSELGQHIAAYGVHLYGNAPCGDNAYPSDESIARKTAVIRERSAAFARFHYILSPRRAVRYAIRIRRDIQRLGLLRAGRAVPPSPMLDEMWNIRSNPCEELQNELAALGVQSPHVITGALTRSVGSSARARMLGHPCDRGSAQSLLDVFTAAIDVSMNANELNPSLAALLYG
jgi:hypothetical protein